MGETQVKLVRQFYVLTDGKYEIQATVECHTGRITISPTQGSKDGFCFIGSKPEVAYAIGTLIRDAADLLKSPDNF